MDFSALYDVLASTPLARFSGSFPIPLKNLAERTNAFALGRWTIWVLGTVALGAKYGVSYGMGFAVIGFVVEWFFFPKKKSEPPAAASSASAIPTPTPPAPVVAAAKAPSQTKFPTKAQAIESIVKALETVPGEKFTENDTGSGEYYSQFLDSEGRKWVIGQEGQLPDSIARDPQNRRLLRCLTLIVPGRPSPLFLLTPAEAKPILDIIDGRLQPFWRRPSFMS